MKKTCEIILQNIKLYQRFIITCVALSCLCIGAVALVEDSPFRNEQTMINDSNSFYVLFFKHIIHITNLHFVLKFPCLSYVLS